MPNDDAFDLSTHPVHLGLGARTVREPAFEGPAFYAAYQAHSPLPASYPLRRDLYKLYHVLNHLNLFGSAYLSRSEGLIDGLLAHIE